MILNLLILLYVCHRLEDLVNLFECFEVFKFSSTFSADLILLFYRCNIISRIHLVLVSMNGGRSSMFRVFTCLLTFECSTPVFI